MLRFHSVPRSFGLILFLFISNFSAYGADRGELLQGGQRAVTIFRDGILFVHAAPLSAYPLIMDTTSIKSLRPGLSQVLIQLSDMRYRVQRLV
jgi:hypothetical protein